MYQGARRTGTVLTVNDKRGIFKMRFDDFPTAEFDYSFTYKSLAWSYIGTPPPSIESTITPVETTEIDKDPLSIISNKLKALINVNLL